MIFKIGDMVRLINSKLTGYIIEECEGTGRYKIKWLTTIWQPDTSWASYDRIEKVS